MRRLDDVRLELPAGSVAGQRVPGRLYADEALFRQIRGDDTLVQLANVGTLPGLVDASLAMPDAHQGYGFPIGGVAAFDVETGVVSPGGIGFDINCGVRLLAADREPPAPSRLKALLDDLFRAVPAGVGRGGALRLDRKAMDGVLAGGAAWAVRAGYGTEADLAHIEAGGRLGLADPGQVSERARQRGRDQLGSLGGGNHFVELQVVEAVFDEAAAAAFGLAPGQLVVSLHTGSRGLGHQVCGDHIRILDGAMRTHGIRVPDRQLACAPIRSREGRAYLGAMAAAANFAFANRQILTALARDVFRGALGGAGLRLVYDVAHNIAQFEEHGGRELLVHRKGATRAFPAGRREVPADYAGVGQPVLIPGSMGTASWVLAGEPGSLAETFGSCCHGAGRRLSRKAALKESRAEAVVADLERRGILVAAASRRGICEEKPDAYKDVDAVVEVVHRAGLARKVARLRPLAVIKG
ncbi:MAG: RtcB family protein [Candidatus Krumholzibacteriota bacterium]|nr:RtcB family protein [Candidatus Krumholzibacteriota bacterium]